MGCCSRVIVKFCVLYRCNCFQAFTELCSQTSQGGESIVPLTAQFQYHAKQTLGVLDTVAFQDGADLRQTGNLLEQGTGNPTTGLGTVPLVGAIGSLRNDDGDGINNATKK